MKFLKWSFLSIFLFVAATSCKEEAKKVIKTEAIAFTKEGTLQIFKKEADTLLADVAMHSFYMKNTEFALDIVYIDENLRIASFQENAQPFNENGLSSQVPIKYVLEVNAGLSEKFVLEVGDQITFIRK